MAEKRPSRMSGTGGQAEARRETNSKYETLNDYYKHVEKAELDIVKVVADAKKAREREVIKELEEYESNLKKQGLVLNKEQAKKFQKEIELQNRKAQLETLKQLSKVREKELKKQEKNLKRQEQALEKSEQAHTRFGNRYWSDVQKEWEKPRFGTNYTELGDKLAKEFGHMLNELGNVINQAIKTYADYQLAIDTRLQGTDKSFSSATKVLKQVAFSPLFKTEDLYSNLSTMIAEGIASNVEQRAFLQTVKDGIATTFDANDKALRRIIRLQQNDTTAARLGMESYLTHFLNKFVQNTEYLTTTFDSVSESLLQASSLLSAQSSTEFEYVVQKWLGSLTGVGLSEATASGIAQVLGYLGSGDINSLSGSNLQNLLVMASSRTKWDYGTLLTEGLNAEKTNALLEEMVNYLKSIDTNNHVVASQFANTFGVTISDLRALRNLTPEKIATITGNNLSYGGMYNELYSQMDTYSSRLGISKILDNLFSNFTFSTGMNIASNPVMYAIWKITDMIQGVTGGINIPFISALGTGVDLNTTVENLMKLGLVGFSTLGSIGDIVTGVSTAFAGNGSKLLASLGIQAGNANIITRGSGFTTDQTFTQSVSSYVTSGAGEDYSQSALQNANEQVKTENPTVEEDPIAPLRELLNSNSPEEILLGQRLREISENTSQINSKIGDSTTKGTIIGLMSLQQ